MSDLSPFPIYPQGYGTSRRRTGPSSSLRREANRATVAAIPKTGTRSSSSCASSTLPAGFETTPAACEQRGSSSSCTLKLKEKGQISEISLKFITSTPKWKKKEKRDRTSPASSFHLDSRMTRVFSFSPFSSFFFLPFFFSFSFLLFSFLSF